MGPPTAVSDFEQKRRAIVDAAAEVFAEKGFVAGTTKDIAATVGLSQPAIYHYAATKEELLHEIAVRVAADMKQALGAALDLDGDARTRLRAFVHNFTGAIIDNRLTFAVYYKEMHQLAPELRERIREAEREFVQGLGGLVHALQKDDILPSDAPPTVVAEGIVGMVSWVHRWYRPDGPLAAPSIAETFLQMLGLDGQ